MYVRHKVADFRAWKPVYDADDTRCKQFGCKSSAVFTNTQHPNDVLAVLDWDTKEQAKKFGQLLGLKEAEDRAGVISVPEVSIGEYGEKQSDAWV